MLPAEDGRGHLTTQNQLCHTFVPLEAPRPFLQPSLCLQGFGGSGEEVSFSKPGVRIRICIEGTIQLNGPHSESFAACPLYFFPLHSGSPHPGSSLSSFIIKGLGKKAWLLSSQTDTAWRGQDGTTSFGKLALSQSVE